MLQGVQLFLARPGFANFGRAEGKVDGGETASAGLSPPRFADPKYTVFTPFLSWDIWCHTTLPFPPCRHLSIVMGRSPAVLEGLRKAPGRWPA